LKSDKEALVGDREKERWRDGRYNSWLAGKKTKAQKEDI
jgi:hypothetical protein